MDLARIIAPAGWYNFARHEGFDARIQARRRAATATGSSARWEGLTRGRSAAGVSHDAPVAAHRRQGNSAQEPEPDLLPDQRRRARSRADRGRHAPAAGLRLVLSLLSRSRAVPDARHDVARDAARRRRREGRSEFGRPPDAVALGTQEAQHPVAGQPDRHAVPARGRRRRSRHDLRARHRDRRSQRAVPFRRDHLSVDRRRRDQRRRVLGIAEHRLHAPGAGALPRRRQRLRDLGPGRSADTRRRHLAPRRIVPEPEGDALRRHRLHRQLSHARRSRGVRAARAQAGVRAREGDSPLLALAVG